MAFHFDCPTFSGFRIIVHDESDLETTEGYLPYTCHACGEIHFVNPLTGRVLGRSAPTSSGARPKAAVRH
jgi:hypothetical protein